jgi:hypothetical protein
MVSHGLEIFWVVVMVSCDLLVLHWPSQRLCQPELPWQLVCGCHAQASSSFSSDSWLVLMACHGQEA